MCCEVYYLEPGVKFFNMMQICRAAVFSVAFAALLTVSLAADRPRQRSGPIRSVPVAADIKRDNDFDCPEEFGYYPHPTDCTLYYVCVFGGALLESCTGGLMYSHELQTCDWPRNVGCDATNLGAERAVDIEREIDVERLNEREPPQPPRRAPPPPPPPRAQPNPVVTSRGQPKYNREDYVKQQLYEEVDDLPPVEEIESDRQQRVYRGQPSTIGQVQRDRDGYTQTNSGRNFNSNVIPASITQGNGKIGSFSFGTQVDDRRAATVTQTPQTYSVNISDVTDQRHTDLPTDILTNEILDHKTKIVKLSSSRTKRAIVDELSEHNQTTTNDTISDRSDLYEVDTGVEADYEDEGLDETERGKRQVRHGRYYIKNGFKNQNHDGKSWANVKPAKIYDFSPYTSNPFQSYQNTRKPTYNSISFPDVSPKASDNIYTTSNPFLQYTTSANLYNDQKKPFKASQPDIFNLRPPHNPINIATHIITKSPPISSLTSNENPFSALAGGFVNNNPQQSNRQFNYVKLNENYRDSSQLPSSVVTDKPVLIASSQRVKTNFNTVKPTKPTQPEPMQYNNNDNDDEEDEDDERDNEEDESGSSENDSSESDFRPHFKPPYEFSHPNNKYADIANPFANPNFDFDAFLTKLRNDHLSMSSSSTPNSNKQNAPITSRPISNDTPQPKPFTSTTLTYKGMSTPQPFTLPAKIVNTWTLAGHNDHTNPSTNAPNITNYQKKQSLQLQQQTLNSFNNAPQISTITQQVSRPRLQPPNFNDDRQLPLNHNFKGNFADQPSVRLISKNPNYSNIVVSTLPPKTYLLVTGKPFLYSTAKPQFGPPQKTITLQTQGLVTPRPHSSTVNPHNANIIFTHPTPKPVLITQAPKPQQYRVQQLQSSTHKPSTVSEIPSLESIFQQTLKPVSGLNSITTTTKTLGLSNIQESLKNLTKIKRRPIPKPSPEMNDYYYDDDDEQYYYEPVVKPKYMPSSEVRPQRPPIAQNYEEYEDDSYEDDDEPTAYKPQTPIRRPADYNTYHVESATKNHNDVSVVTKPPYKNLKHNINGKIPVPVIMDNVTPTPHILIRPEVSNYKIMHQQRNRTVHLRRPLKRPTQGGPHTIRPPKYLNQTTLRPYTVRHRLAKPTTVRMPTTTNNQNKQVNGRLRNPTTMSRFKSTTPSDNHNQETRFTKTKHDDRTNSLEPTESVTPVSYNTPRPKMLYNGSQSYNPDQFDPYYVYDEDGELYKDTVQQTYRGTPPPPRRPVDTYTPRPVSVDDYDDVLIKGQINTQNQYQTPIRTSPRDEGNELGYDHNPSSVRTTIYEATSISTTPSTTTSTSTSTTTTTTTQRPTTAQFTEAMTPSRYTPRSSSDESQNPIPPANASADKSSVPNSPTDLFVNFSSLAKPFEKTNNSHRFRQTVIRTDLSKRPSKVSTDNNKHLAHKETEDTNTDKKIVSLTTGFSIRRNANNDDNPYTLTIISRPSDNSNVSDKSETVTKLPNLLNTYYEVNTENNQNAPTIRKPNNSPIRRTDSSEEYTSIERDSSIIYEKPSAHSNENSQILKKLSSTARSTLSPKYYLKVIKRPAPFSNDNQYQGSTENSIETDVLIEKGLQNARDRESSKELENYEQSIGDAHKSDKQWVEPAVSPYTSLNNLRNSYGIKYDKANEFITSTLPTAYVPTTLRNEIITTQLPKKQHSTLRPNYLSYKYSEDDGTEPEVFTSTAKQILRAFFKNFDNNVPKTQKSNQPIVTSSTFSPYTTEKTVNIGFHKKFHSYDLPNSKHSNKNNKRVEIITEGAPLRITLQPQLKEPVTLSTTSTSTISNSYRYYNDETTPSYYTQEIEDASVNRHEDYDENKSIKFNKVLSQTTEKAETNYSPNNKIDVEPARPTNIDNVTTTFTDQDSDKEINDLSTPTKPTVLKTVPKSTKSNLPFPTRTSRVNPAIKLAATNLGGGRRSYQSSTKCSTDDSLQANPKCNEIKYQRPTSTRGRGHAHYSTQNGGEQPQLQQTANRGTPPTRSRPTLKPSTAIVKQDKERVTKDIYESPPSRPAPVYPQPTPDKTAAKCRKDVCLLPDCYCGGKDIPGDLPVESIPQIVLLTFDDSVNDLNKGLYSDLFEKGRVNPNGCPISATFYVSHEWTDYSQVQNLYAAGHEMASHTISHSFGEQFSQKKWNKEVGGQREILSAYGGVKLEDVRGMRAPFLSVGGNKMFKMLYDSNFTYDSSMPVYENRPPSWPYTLDYKLFHDCMIPPCPTRSYPGVWEVPMVMWQDLNGGRCSMGDACANPPEADGVYKMLLKNFDRHYTTNRAPFGLFYHAAWFTQPHHKEGFIMFLDFINQMQDVWIVTNWQALQWVRDPTPISRLNSFQPFQCNYQDRPKKCNNPRVCNLWHKSGVRYMRTCQPCPEIYPWTGKTGIRSSRIDNEIEE